MFFDCTEDQRSCEQELLERRGNDGHGLKVETVLGGLVELKPGGRLSLYKTAERQGLTRRFFGPEEQHRVTVKIKKGAHT